MKNKKITHLFEGAFFLLIITVADKIIGADVKEHRKIVYYRCVRLGNAGFPVRNRALTCADCFCKFGLRYAFLCP